MHQYLETGGNFEINIWNDSIDSSPDFWQQPWIRCYILTRQLHRYPLKCNKKMLADRTLISKKGVISCNIIIELLHRLEEEASSTLNAWGLLGMRKSVAIPDNFSHQNVNDAKFVFSERTLAFLLQQVADNCSYWCIITIDWRN